MGEGGKSMEKNNNPKTPCCEMLEHLPLYRHTTDDGKKCMPHLFYDGERYRINYCTSCGADIRMIML
jgi:hypothetical protein